MAKYNRKTIEKWPNQKLVMQFKNGKNKPEVSFAFNFLNFYLNEFQTYVFNIQTISKSCNVIMEMYPPGIGGKNA